MCKDRELGKWKPNFTAITRSAADTERLNVTREGQRRGETWRERVR